jgi:hypothetical protein
MKSKTGGGERAEIITEEASNGRREGFREKVGGGRRDPQW